MSTKLTTDEFKKKVFDFQAGPDQTAPDWKFEGDLPCIVDFYADWCGPCKMVSPILDQISQEYAGKVNIYKVNTDEEQEVSQAFGIQSIPSLLFIPKTGDPRMSMGAMPKPQILKAMKEVLSVE
ncbi:MAG: thioredoxin [Spirochaetales bacterium]